MLFRENKPERSDGARAMRGQLPAVTALVVTILILIVGSIAVSTARDDVVSGTETFGFLRDLTGALEVAALGVLVLLVVGVVAGILTIAPGTTSGRRR